LYHKDKIRVSKQIVDMEKKWYLKIEVDKEKWNVRKIFIWEIKKLKKEITTVKKPIVEKEDTYRWKVGEGIVEKEYTPIVEKDNHYRRKRQP
jgi:hypothetical protein